VSFNTTVRQMTKMFQEPTCLSENGQNVSVKKKTTDHHTQSAVI